MKKLLILLITFTFATELEVDGSLKVTGGIDAQGQPISNVGNPVNANDAIPMSAVSGVVTNAMSLAGMNPPERIYQYLPDDELNVIVPDGKAWHVFAAGVGSSGFTIYINEKNFSLSGTSGNGGRQSQVSFWCQANDTLSLAWSLTNRNGIMSIYEYSITSSGTSQGMDYVEP